MIKTFRKSLILKWMIFSILLATIPLAVAGFNIIQIYQKDLKESIIEIKKEKANIIIERNRSLFEMVISDLLFLTKEEGFEMEHPSTRKRHLENLLHHHNYLVELTLLDEMGNETVRISRYEANSPSGPKDQLNSEMFEVVSKGEYFYKDFFSPEDIFPTVIVAVPIKKYPGKLTGVLSAKIYLRYFWNLIPQALAEGRDSAYVIGKGGFVIDYPDASRVLLGPFVDRASAGEEGVLELENLRGKKYLVVYKSIKELGWCVVVQVPVEEAYEPIKRVAKTALKWILVALTVAVILSLFLTRKLTLPIKQLSDEMTKVSKGNLDVHIGTTKKDEMGLLTDSFNQMVHDLKHSHEAIKEAEERYRKIFENSKDMIYITSVDGKWIDVNQAGVEIFGYGNKEELMQIQVRNTYLNPEERMRFRNEIEKEGFVKDFEVKLKKKDGTPIDVLITANVRKDDSGDIIGYEGIIKDVSSRKRMEEELLQRKEELQTLHHLSTLLNQSLNLDEVLIVALDNIMELTNFEMGRILIIQEDEKTIETIIQKGYPDGFLKEASRFDMREGLAGAAIQKRQSLSIMIDEHPTPRLKTLLKEEGIQSVASIPLVAKDRAIGTINLASRTRRIFTQKEIDLLESIGNQIGLALENAKLFSDVAKGKSEWEATFDAVTDLITIRDQDYRILRANKAAFKRYGLQPQEMIGKKCYELLNRRETPCEGCYVSEALITKKPAFGERESQYLNGIFQYFTFPVYNEVGEVTAVVDLAREITEQKRLEMEKEVVNNITKIIASSLDAREVMKAVHSELKRVLASERMTITLLDEEGEGFRYFALAKDFEANELIEGILYPKQGTPFGKAVDTGLPVIISDTAEGDSWVDQKLLKEGIRSSLVFPLEYKGKIIGTINFGSKETNHFSEDHFNFLYSIATGLAISIQNALLFEETKKRLDELTILYEIMKISVSSLDLDQMLTEIVNNLNNFFKFEALGILLVDENTKRLLPHPSYIGLSVEKVEKLVLCLGRGITGWVAEKGEPLLVNDVREDSRYLSAGEDVLSEMCVPLKVGQKIIGVIDAESKKLNTFTEDHLRLINIAAGQISTIIESIRLQEEMKQSEERYRTVVEGAHDGICVIGKDNRFKYVNHRLAEISGYLDEELIGMDFRNILDEESQRLMADRFTRRERGEKLSSGFELNAVRKDGDIRNIEINAKVMKDSQGEINYIVFAKDITEKKKMEEQLFQSEKLRSLGEMASGVAHDFNNALAAILGNTQLLLYTAKDEELRETLQIIEKVAKDSAQTVRRLQDFTRKKGHQELFKLDINPVIKDAIEITRPKWKDEAQGRGIRIEMVSNLGEIPPVSGTASEMREVIINLIFNAIEAMPEGGRIEVQTFQKGGKTCIQVSDTGIGMTEEVRKKAFEPFFTTKPFSNTGLGLSVSYGIINRFGGEMEVESKVGYGTTFTITFPVGLEGRKEPIVSTGIRKGRGARILIVDDEENVRTVLSKILGQVNYQVMVAESGEEGIRLFQENAFDMVLTDLGMPGISGWEVCQSIKKMSPHTPVGMITGWENELRQSKMKECGLDFLLSKPFDFNQILKIVAETMESKEKQFLS